MVPGLGRPWDPPEGAGEWDVMVSLLTKDKGLKMNGYIYYVLCYDCRLAVHYCRLVLVGAPLVTCFTDKRDSYWRTRF